MIKPFNLCDNVKYFELSLLSALTWLANSDLPFTVYYFGQYEAIPALEAQCQAYGPRFSVVCKPRSAINLNLSATRWPPVVFERFALMNEIGAGALYVDSDIFLLNRMLPKAVARLEVLAAGQGVFAATDMTPRERIAHDAGLALHMRSTLEYYCSGILLMAGGQVDCSRIYTAASLWQAKTGRALAWPDQDAMNIANARQSFITKLEVTDLAYWDPRKVYAAAKKFPAFQKTPKARTAVEQWLAMAKAATTRLPTGTAFHVYGEKHEAYMTAIRAFCSQILATAVSASP